MIEGQNYMVAAGQGFMFVGQFVGITDSGLHELHDASMFCYRDSGASWFEVAEGKNREGSHRYAHAKEPIECEVLWSYPWAGDLPAGKAEHAEATA